MSLDFFLFLSGLIKSCRNIIQFQHDTLQNRIHVSNKMYFFGHFHFLLAFGVALYAIWRGWTR